MATRPEQAEWLVEQMSGAGAVSARKTFGEYGVYCGGKMVALICDDELFIRPTEAGRRYIGAVVERSPFPKAKAHFYISGDQAEDRDWLADLIRQTAAELPEPAPKPARRRATPKKRTSPGS